MNYWLMNANLHITDLQGVRMGRFGGMLPFDAIRISSHVKRGDLVYLIQDSHLIGWGNIQNICEVPDPALGKRYQVYVPTSNICREDINTNFVPEITNLLNSRTKTFEWLSSSQVRRLNKLPWPLQFRPPDPPAHTFIRGSKVDLEEPGGKVEFKAFVRPSYEFLRESVKDKVDKYAVGFFNREGGSIFWGITDSRETQEIGLDDKQRDDISKLIESKLRDIREYNGAAIITSADYSIERHPVCDKEGVQIEESFVLEVQFAPGNPAKVYATSSNKVYLKGDSSNDLLSGERLNEFLRKRGYL